MNEIVSEEEIYQSTYGKEEKIDSRAYLSVRKKLYRIVKRSFDIVSAAAALILLSPVFFIIAIIIKQEDGGPVIYRQSRIGQNGKPILVYKFRSMRVGAENVEEMLTPEQLKRYRQEYKLDEDPRITRCGGKLRKTSLDELPQLVNIIKGEMSVIGPRPVLEDELLHYGQNRRKFLSIKPGLTGYWQAYARNTVTYESGERQRMEMYYIENAGVLLDIRILFKTISTVIKKKGAK